MLLHHPFFLSNGIINSSKMKTQQKSTVSEIKAKFDKLADNYSNLQTGQATAIDSPLCMELITKSAIIYTPNAKDIMDIGCGGGNYLVKLTQLLPHANCTLIDLSDKMLERASARVGKETSGKVATIQGDIREIELEENSHDIIIAATVLHHLRTEEEWQAVFTKVYKTLRKGGSFWINDVIIHENHAINQLMHQGWIDHMKPYLSPEKIQWCIDQYVKEDTPQTVNFQINMMNKVGFKETQILHKHYNFAAFGAIK